MRPKQASGTICSQFAGCASSLPVKVLHEADFGRARVEEDPCVENVDELRIERKGLFHTILLCDTLENIPPPFQISSIGRLSSSPRWSYGANVPAMNWLYSRDDEVVGRVNRSDRAILAEELSEAALSLDRHVYRGMMLSPVVMARKLVVGMLPHTKLIKGGFQASWQTA